jgi:hypothetical protein
MNNTESNVTNWYYFLDEQQFGPVSSDAIASLLTHNILNAQTMVSSDMGNNWKMLQQTSLWKDNHVVEHEVESDTSLTWKSSSWNSAVASSDNEFDQRIDGYYFQFWLWSIIGIPLLLIVIGFIPLIVATVFECIILYHAWKAIPNNRYGVPPIIAVLLLFAPVVGTIWCFWAFYFMSKEMNQALTQKGDSYQVNESIVLAGCVLSGIASVFFYVPTVPTFIIGMIVLVPSAIVGIFSMRSIKDGVLALHQYEKQMIAK